MGLDLFFNALQLLSETLYPDYEDPKARVEELIDFIIDN